VTPYRAPRPRPTAGQSLPLIALLLPMLLAAVGLALDGGTIFAARRELQSVADSAARAGAVEVSVDHFRTSGGTVILLPSAATTAAEDWILEYNRTQAPEQRVDLDGPVRVAQDQIVVRVTRQAKTAFVRLVGIDSVPIRAEALARARPGGA
jgi:Flp pilus assembly protein TadG